MFFTRRMLSETVFKKYQFYDTVNIDSPKKKILEFNEKNKFMEKKDLKWFESLCEILKDKS